MDGEMYPIAIDYDRYVILKYCDFQLKLSKSVQFKYFTYITIWPWQVGPCLHDMWRPQIADVGTASNMEGSFEYIEWAVADSRQGVLSQLGGWTRR